MSLQSTLGREYCQGQTELLMPLFADARDPAKIIADLDNPVAMQKNTARYSLTGIFLQQLAEGQGWNHLETQDAEEIARQLAAKDSK